MLPLFAPWALLPWDVAWFAWRGGTILLLLWSIRWAYARRPLPTAILLALLWFSIGAILDTGKINLLLALALFGAQSTSGWIGGLIWGLATWMKWVLRCCGSPCRRAPAAGPGVPGLSALLSLVMLPLTIIQLQVLFGFGNRPLRADYLVFVWSAVPWWWRHADPFAFLRPAWWVDTLRLQRARARRLVAAFRAEPRRTMRQATDQFRPGAAGTWAWTRRHDGARTPRSDTRTRPWPRSATDRARAGPGRVRLAETAGRGGRRSASPRGSRAPACAGFDGTPALIERDGGMETREQTICGAHRRIAEQGPVQGVQGRGGDPDLAQSEGEHRVLRIAA